MNWGKLFSVDSIRFDMIICKYNAGVYFRGVLLRNYKINVIIDIKYGIQSYIK